MKKIIALTLALVMALGIFAGCGSDSAETTAPAGNDTTPAGTDAADTTPATNGVLKVATSPDFAPMEFVDPTKTGQDQFVGFDIMLAKFIAQELGMELEIMPMDFNACQMAVYAGTVDMAISGFSWKEDRAANYNLSDYYHAGDNEDEQILITLAGNEGKFTTAESLEGLKVGAQNASLQQELATEQLPGAEIVLFNDLGTAVLQLQNGDFDCIAVADGNATAIIANNPNIIKSGFNFFVDEKYTGNVIMMQKGNDDLTAKVNEILAKAEQYYDAWYAEAKSIAGIDVSYDENGNPIPAE